MFVPGFMCTQSIPGPAKYTTNKKCLRPGQGWLVSVLEMFMFAQLISRPELTFLMIFVLKEFLDLRTVIIGFMTS